MVTNLYGELGGHDRRTLARPERALAIGAHPDDIEFGAAGTLAKWRKGLPAGFEVALRAPMTAWSPTDGPLRGGDALDRGLAWLTGAVDALEPSLLVIATGAAVTTGARDRTRLRDYFQRLPRPEGRCWSPTRP